MQGGYADGAAHLVAFATTQDVFVLLWRSEVRSDGTTVYLGHRLLSMREVASKLETFRIVITDTE